ncbi:c-type cytochrome [Pseudogemmobacter humi]|uniref:Cytochrome c-556 n=1 Tax=Pseudogemmobacter humi TaxID=2483812 RepID=A0A3P5XAF4_9RHOB|nr:cytochrome c [Pseudogemmobacter humi]VDC27239.1 Cytochrome c-556 [Pseudogemmobacter humi]
MKAARTAALLLILAPVAALAADPTQPEAIARANVMKEVGKNTKILGEMAQGKTAFDAAAAEAAKAALIAAAAAAPAAFEVQGAEDPVSEARPEIWTGWEDFTAKATDLRVAAEGVDTASADGLRTGMATLSGTCKACHSVYRE